MTWEVNLTTIAAFVVGVLAVSRFTRLMVDDDFPPVMWIRRRYIRLTRESTWSDLMACPFCMATWPGLADLILAWVLELSVWWWIPNIWFAGIYLAAMVNVRDIPPDGPG